MESFRTQFYMWKNFPTEEIRTLGTHKCLCRRKWVGSLTRILCHPHDTFRPLRPYRVNVLYTGRLLPVIKFQSLVINVTLAEVVNLSYSDKTDCKVGGP